jgi:hypothetical protein
MQKSIIIDTSKLVYSLWDQYQSTLLPREGGLTQKQWIRKFKVNDTVTEKVKDKISNISTTEFTECYHKFTTITYSCDSVNRELVITLTWLENCNINDWMRWIKNDVKLINDLIWINGLTAYIK